MILKKFIFRIILAVVFIFLTLTIILEWCADTRFRNGQKLEAAYRWPEAKAEYERAIALDPYDAEYLSGLGNFLYSKDISRKDKNLRLSEAEYLYKRAIKLDPRDSRNYLMLGLTDLRLYENDPKVSQIVMRNFQSAVANDPHGFNISYEVGYAGLSLWGRLDPEGKKFILARLRHAIKQHPEFADYIYPRLWRLTRDPAVLSRLRSEQSEAGKKERLAMIAVIKQKNKVKAGAKAFENVSLYWKETIDRPIYVPQGESTLKIRASGTPAHNIYPYMIVEIDGQEIGETFVDSVEWKDYSFKVNSEAGGKVLSLTFANDYHDDKSDRNLFIKEAAIINNER